MRSSVVCRLRPARTSGGSTLGVPERCCCGSTSGVRAEARIEGEALRCCADCAVRGNETASLLPGRSLDLKSRFREPGLRATTGEGWSVESVNEPASEIVSSPRMLSAEGAAMRARTWLEAPPCSPVALHLPYPRTAHVFTSPA